MSSSSSSAALHPDSSSFKKKKNLYKFSPIPPLWARIIKNTDWSTEPLARLFARSLTPLACGTVNDWMAIYSVSSILDHSALVTFDSLVCLAFLPFLTSLSTVSTLHPDFIHAISISLSSLSFSQWPPSSVLPPLLSSLSLILPPFLLHLFPLPLSSIPLFSLSPPLSGVYLQVDRVRSVQTLGFRGRH